MNEADIDWTVVAGVLVAVVLLVFRPESGGDLSGAGLESAIASVETPLELVPEIPNPENPGSDFTGSGQSPFSGITQDGIDPEFFIMQLEMAGVDVPDGASTKELVDLLDAAVKDGLDGLPGGLLREVTLAVSIGRFSLNLTLSRWEKRQGAGRPVENRWLKFVGYWVDVRVRMDGYS